MALLKKLEEVKPERKPSISGVVEQELTEIEKALKGGYSIQQIASALGIEKDYFNNALHRARKRRNAGKTTKYQPPPDNQHNLKKENQKKTQEKQPDLEIETEGKTLTIGERKAAQAARFNLNILKGE